MHWVISQIRSQTRCHAVNKRRVSELNCVTRCDWHVADSFPTGHNNPRCSAAFKNHLQVLLWMDSRRLTPAHIFVLTSPLWFLWTASGRLSFWVQPALWKWFSTFTVKWMLAVCLTAIRQLLRPEMVWFCGERRGFIVEHKKDLARAEQGCFFFFFCYKTGN